MSDEFEPAAHKKSFFNHVFSTTEEGKAEILNIVQYAILGVIPVMLLNKLIMRFIPDADTDKSTIEIILEILIQLILIFVGVILIHRVITYIPTYSEFKYENLNLISVVLTFLVVILSIQTKLGIKANILFDRASELWNGPTDEPSGGRKKTDMRRRPKEHEQTSPESLLPAPMPMPMPRDDYPTGPVPANQFLGKF